MELGVHGWVRNNPDGKVEAQLCGSEESLTRLTRQCESGPTAAAVEQVQWSPSSQPCPDSFRIL